MAVKEVGKVGNLPLGLCTDRHMKLFQEYIKVCVIMDLKCEGLILVILC